MADREAGKAYITLRADEAAINADITKLKQRLAAALSQVEKNAKFKVVVDSRAVTDLENKLKGIRTQMQLISGTTVRPTLDASSISQAQAQATNLRDSLHAISGITARPTVDTTNIAAASHIPDQEFAVNADTSNAVAGIAMLHGSIGELAAVAGAAMGLMGILQAGKSIATFAVTTTAALEQVQVAFGGMFGNEATAEKFIGELQQFAAVTPFEFDQLTSSAQRLLGTFGKQFKEELIPTLETIGNVAGALGADASSIDRVVVALSQIQGKGRVATEELNQIREALPGFNAVKAVADGLGITLPEATKKLEMGAISAQDGIKYLLEGMEKFPGAAGAMDRQSQTLNGRISTLKDTVKLAAIEGFDPLTVAVGEVVTSLSQGLGAGQFDTLITDLNDTLTSGIEEIAPSIIPLAKDIAESLGNIFERVGPVIGKLLPIIGDILVPLSEILGDLVASGGQAAAEIGGQLIPVFETLADVTHKIPVGVLVQLFKAFVALKIAGTVTSLISAVATKMISLGVSFGVVSATAPAAAAGELEVAAASEVMGASVSAALGPISLVIAALAFLALTLLDTGETERTQKQHVDDFTTSLTANTIELLANADAQKLIAKNGSAALDVTGLLRQALEATVGDDAFSTYAGKFGTTVSGLANDTTKFKNAVDEVHAAIGSDKEVDITGTWLKDVIEGTTAAPPLLKDLSAQFGGAADEVFRLAISSGDYKETLNALDLADELAPDSLIGNLGDLTQAQKDAIKTAIDYAKSLDGIDMDKEVTASLRAAAAQDDLSKSALVAAESFTHVDRNTTDANDALKLYERFLVEAAKAGVDLSNIEPVHDLSGLQAELSAILTPLQLGVATASKLKSGLATLSGSKLSFTEAISDLEALKRKMTGATLTPLELANAAASALKSTLDAISGVKLNVTDMISNAEAQFDAMTTRITELDAEGNVVSSKTGVRAAEEGKSGVDLATEAGRVNTKTITDIALARRAISDQIFADTHNAEEAAKSYTDSIEVVRQGYIKAGGSAADFDEVIRANSLTPIEYTVAVDDASTKAVVQDLGVLKAEAGKGSFDVTTAAGSANAKMLLDYYEKIQGAANATLATTHDSEAAMQTYSDEVDILRKNYINAAVAAGDSAEKAGRDFDKFAADHSLTRVEYRVEMGKASKATLETELAKLKSLDDPTRKTIQDLIDKGDYTKATEVLQALSEVNIVSLDPEVDANKKSIAEQELLILTLARDVSINPKLSPEFIALVNAELGGITAATPDALDRALYNSGAVPRPGEEVPGAFAGGMTMRMAGTTSHMWNAATIATQGARFMYGEPSTHGEAFISLHPDFQNRNVRIWEEVGRRLGATEMRTPSNVDTGATRQLSRIAHRLERLEDAFMTMPPITITAIAGDPSNAAAKLWWQQRKRAGR